MQMLKKGIIYWFEIRGESIFAPITEEKKSRPIVWDMHLNVTLINTLFYFSVVN